MRIEYRRSGGIAGIDLTASADADELPAELSPVASALLRDAFPARPTGPGMPDGFNYELTVHEAGRARTHHWSEGEVPEVVRPLLTDLGSRAHPAPPR